MKRAPLIILVLAAVAAVPVVVLRSELAAAPPESEELALPAVSPAVVNPDVPTYVTFTATLTDPDLKAPKIQVFDPAKGKWLNVKPLKDDGKAEDTVKDDRVFTKKLWILVASETTQIGFEKGSGAIKVKRTVPSPAQLRLLAKRKGQRGLLVSPPVVLRPWEVIVNNDAGYSVTVPPGTRVAHTSSTLVGQEIDDLAISVLTDGDSELNVRITSAALLVPAVDLNEIEIDTPSGRVLAQAPFEIAGRQGRRSEVLTPEGIIISYEVISTTGKLVEISVSFSQDVEASARILGDQIAGSLELL